MTPRSSRRQSAKQQAELAGLGADAAGVRGRGRHVLELPVNPQFDDRTDEAIESGRVPWLVFDDVEEVERDPVDTRQSLWDFADLAPKATREQMKRFVTRWGLLGQGAVQPLNLQLVHRSDRDSLSCNMRHWRWLTSMVRNLLQLMSTTESGDLIDDDILEQIASRERWRYSYEFALRSEEAELKAALERDPVRLAKEADAVLQDVLEHWQAARREGLGLEVQRRLAVRVLHYLLLPSLDRGSERVEWDEEGRRLVEPITKDTGVMEIVKYHLMKVFASEQMDIYKCSVCGRLFSHDDERQERRPKKGQRRFCGDDCRSAAKRVDNLASWHRNKSRWTRPQRSKEGPK